MAGERKTGISAKMPNHIVVHWLHWPKGTTRSERASERERDRGRHDKKEELHTKSQHVPLESQNDACDLSLEVEPLANGADHRLQPQPLHLRAVLGKEHNVLPSHSVLGVLSGRGHVVAEKLNLCKTRGEEAGGREGEGEE